MKTKHVINAIMAEKQDMEAKHGPANMNTLELGKYIRLMERDIVQAKASEMIDMDIAARKYILQTAALAVQCLERHGLTKQQRKKLGIHPVTQTDIDRMSGEKEADSAATEPADGENATKSAFHINEFYAERINP